MNYNKNPTEETLNKKHNNNNNSAAHTQFDEVHTAFGWSTIRWFVRFERKKKKFEKANQRTNEKKTENQHTTTMHTTLVQEEEAVCQPNQNRISFTLPITQRLSSCRWLFFLRF